MQFLAQSLPVLCGDVSAASQAAEPIPLAEPDSRLDSLFQWIDTSGTLGIGAYIGIFILASLLLVPTSILAVPSGWFWGMTGGGIVLFISFFLASSLGFIITRSLARKHLVSKFGGGPRFDRFDSAITEKGAVVLFFFRLAPIFPLGVCNYACGLTGIRYSRYILASMLGLIPTTLLFVYSGTLKKAGVEEEPGWIGTLSTGLVFVAIFGGLWFLGRILRKSLMLDKGEENGDRADGES